MEPKQKAKQLIERYEMVLPVIVSNNTSNTSRKLAKQCALIYCDGIINEWKSNKWLVASKINYWQEVKAEIMKL